MSAFHRRCAEKGSARKNPSCKSLHRSGQYYSTTRNRSASTVSNGSIVDGGDIRYDVYRGGGTFAVPHQPRQTRAESYQQPRLGNRRLVGKYGLSSSSSRFCRSSQDGVCTG